MVALLFVDWLLQTNTPPRILQYTTIYLYEMKYQNNICNYSSDLCICCVAIHVPAKGTTELDSAIGHASTALQSTFPRRERQVDLIHAIQVLQVSIHVPAKGTTAIIHKFLYVPYYYLYNYTNIILIEQVHLPYTSYSPLIFSQYCGANPPDTLCSLLFRTRPALHCCFI